MVVVLILCLCTVCGTVLSQLLVNCHKSHFFSLIESWPVLTHQTALLYNATDSKQEAYFLNGFLTQTEESAIPPLPPPHSEAQRHSEMASVCNWHAE